MCVYWGLRVFCVVSLDVETPKDQSLHDPFPPFSPCKLSWGEQTLWFVHLIPGRHCEGEAGWWDWRLNEPKVPVHPQHLQDQQAVASFQEGAMLSDLNKTCQPAIRCKPPLPKVLRSTTPSFSAFHVSSTQNSWGTRSHLYTPVSEHPAGSLNHNEWCTPCHFRWHHLQDTSRAAPDKPFHEMDGPVPVPVEDPPSSAALAAQRLAAGDRSTLRRPWQRHRPKSFSL